MALVLMAHLDTGAVREVTAPFQETVMTISTTSGDTPNSPEASAYITEEFCDATMNICRMFAGWPPVRAKVG
jgi:hypothetical protein